MTAWNRYICLYLSVEPGNQELYCDTATCELPHCLSLKKVDS